MNFEERVRKIKEEAEKELAGIKDYVLLEQLRLQLLGRKGEISILTDLLSKLSPPERKRAGIWVNELKNYLNQIFFKKQRELGRKTGREIKIDLTLPGIKFETGHLHPLTHFLRKVAAIFQKMGFEIAEGPEIEEEKYNFDLLNIPQWHPARDAWDTFWLKSNSKLKTQDSKLLLRTHTSPVQLRAMETREPPVRLIVPGRAFRHEATDPAHETTFYQCEGLAIDRCVRVTDLIGTLRAFLQTLFGQVEIRVRPHYYPFVEPGMDIDMSCLICNGKGCSVCKQTGWLEMLGSGMVHPQVLRNMKINPEEWSGFAFGLGIDRFMMLYYGVDDIRLSYNGDLRFVRQF